MQLLQLQAIGGAPEVMVDVFSKNVMHVPVAGVPVEALGHWVIATFIHTWAGRRISEITARGFPLGQFLVAVKPEEPAARSIGFGRSNNSFCTAGRVPVASPVS